MSLCGGGKSNFVPVTGNHSQSLTFDTSVVSMAEEILKTEDVERIVELSKKVSEQETEIVGYKDKISTCEAEIEKYKSDIIRLQKIISDNFVASKEQPKSEITASKTFADVYKEMIEKNNKR